jgi:hypothetical protein
MMIDEDILRNEQIKKRNVKLIICDKLCVDGGDVVVVAVLWMSFAIVKVVSM